MPRIDLDAARAARREVKEETPTAMFGGREFALPAELPFGVFVSLAEMREDPEGSVEAMTHLLEALFGDEAQAFIDLGPSIEDIQALVEGSLGAYGLAPEDETEEALGESSASAV